MPDVARPPEPEPTRNEEFAQALVAMRDRMDDAVHLAVTGTQGGSLRRKVLFLILAVGLWGAADSWVFSLTGLICLILLVATDDIIE